MTRDSGLVKMVLSLPLSGETDSIFMFLTALICLKCLQTTMMEVEINHQTKTSLNGQRRDQIFPSLRDLRKQIILALPFPPSQCDEKSPSEWIKGEQLFQ